jgi:hypothetical protein
MFYVYVYRDPRPNKNKQPVYVGKGTGRRAWQHWEGRVPKNPGFGSLLAQLRRLELVPHIEIVKDELTEAEAFYEEMRLIEAYGRRDLGTGTLFNLTDGGEGFAGILRTPEWAARISAAHCAPDRRAAQVAETTRRWATPEYRERTVAAIREALKDPEVIARREAGKAAFIHTEEFRQTMCAATTKMWQDPEYAERVVEAQKAAHKRPEVRAGKAQATKATWAKEDVREKRAEGIKQARSTDASKAKTSAQASAQWADPTYAAQQTANNQEIANRPEVKAAKAAALKARWADPEFKARMLEARKKKTLPNPTCM